MSARNEKLDQVVEEVDDIGFKHPASDRFRDKLAEALKSDGSKPIRYPHEILQPYVDTRVRGGTWTPAGPKTLAAALGHLQLCPPELLSHLKKLDADYADLARKQERYSLVQANKSFDDQKRKFIETAQSGDLPDSQQVTHRNRDDLQAEYRHRWSAFDVMLNKISIEAAKLALPIWEKAAAVISDSMDGFELSERNYAESFDVPWQPSNVYRVHATLLLHCRLKISALSLFLNGAQGYSHMAPRTAFDPIVTFDSI